VYHFLATPRWLGLAALTVLLALIMVGLGDWQLHRYRARSEINARIDAAASAPPASLAAALPPPGVGPGRAGPRPPARVEWTRVRVTGRYDAGHEVLARGRTVSDAVGYEVLTPLVLDDGSAVLVDRGWLPPPPGGALVAPAVPAPPTGVVAVTGRVRLPESRADAPISRTGRPEVRRISPARIAPGLPYPVYGAYLTLEEQTPAADAAFTAVPPDHQNAWQNAGYVVQWWAFAALTLVGYGYLARREADARSGERVTERV
jgi:cytochrome oxidase assembly protein ShyY1